MNYSVFTEMIKYKNGKYSSALLKETISYIPTLMKFDFGINCIKNILKLKNKIESKKEHDESETSMMKKIELFNTIENAFLNKLNANLPSNTISTNNN